MTIKSKKESMNKWDTLPNAKHIDFVIESVKKYPDEWVVARDATWYAALDAAWDAAYYAAWGEALNEALDAVWDAAYYAARDAILALVAYDDCEQYLDMSYDELLFMAKLTQIPATILLLPYAKAMELVKEKI
jgi:hypothetical protein